MSRAQSLPTRLRRLAKVLAERPLPATLEQRLRTLLEEAERAGEAPPKQDAEPAAGSGVVPVEALRLDAARPIRIWCDGSCAPNPGAGGWGAIVEQDGRRAELSGGAAQSTNNIMELTAALEALRVTPQGAPIHVTTDSRYVMDGIRSWLPRWKRKGWLTAERKPVKNQALWQALDALVSPRTVTWEWVAGHSGHPENERCDALANAARRAL